MLLKHFAITFLYTVSYQCLHVLEATNNIIYSFLRIEYQYLYGSVHVVSIGT